MSYRVQVPDKCSLPEGFAEHLVARLGAEVVVTDPSARERFLVEERGLFRSHAMLALTPASTEELALAVRLCAEAGVPMVPQGGNTGLVGGAVAGRGEIIVSLHRMNDIRDVDPVNFTITVEAGCVLAAVQDAAQGAGCLFPLSLGAEGSCTIGGNIASNAGGVGVLKYGNTRDLTLGLEAVLPDGRIWNGMRALYKDNSGYSLKNLFIGSEGTLGCITAAIMRLYPQAVEKETAMCALASVENALALLSLARRRGDDRVTAFELMSDFSLGIVCDHAGGQHPFAESYPWYGLVELSSSMTGQHLRGIFEELLEEAIEEGIIQDAVVAESLGQAKRLWHLRETIPEAQKLAGGSIKHDISVPVSHIPRFIAEASAAVAERLPGVRVCAFGHVGDGNVHYNLTQPKGMDKQEFLKLWQEMNDIVHAIAMQLGGSISAEHGIGLLKVSEIQSYRAPVERDMMAALKAALDPHDLMNPGKLVPSKPRCISPPPH